MTRDARRFISSLEILEHGFDFVDTLEHLQHWIDGRLHRLLLCNPDGSPAPSCVHRPGEIVGDPCHPAMPSYPGGDD